MTFTTIALASVACLALATAGTFLLPRHIEIEREALMDSAPRDILALASSNQGYQEFNPYRTADPALNITAFGPESGVGSGFHFEGKDGTGTQTVAEVTDTRVRYDIDLGAMGTPTQTIQATAVEGGTLVDWTMSADLGMNPVARVFGLFMDGMIGKTFEQGLTNLQSAT